MYLHKHGLRAWVVRELIGKYVRARRAFAQMDPRFNERVNLENVKVYFLLHGVGTRGCFAVGNLAAKNSANTDKLVRAGVCKALMDALRAFGKTNDLVAEYGCQALANLASDNYDDRMHLGQMDACELVVAVLSAFGKTHKGVAAVGCLAAGNLVNGNGINAGKLGKAGACEAVVDALRAFGTTNDQVAEYGCHAVANLGVYMPNVDKLSAAGACELVVLVLSAFGKTHHKVAECGCNAVAHLIYRDDANQKKNGPGWRLRGCGGRFARLWQNTRRVGRLRMPRGG